MTPSKPPQANSDMVALQAQCDISRLFDVVLFPAVQAVEQQGLVSLPISDWSDEPVAYGLSGFERPPAAPQMLLEVREAMLDETRRGLAVILGAAFERHVRTWLTGKEPSAQGQIASENWRSLTDRVHALLRVDLRAIEHLTADLRELWELVSASRHGDGGAAANLAEVAPHLWPTTALLDTARSADLRVTEQDLRRYYGAVLVFWGAVGATPCPERRPPRTS